MMNIEKFEEIVKYNKKLYPNNFGKKLFLKYRDENNTTLIKPISGLQVLEDGTIYIY